MTTIQNTAARAPRWMKAVLAVSLALNLLIAGLAVGQFAAGPPDRSERGPRGASMALGPLGRALDREDRRAIVASLRSDGQSLRDLRRLRVEGQTQIIEALQAEPFDRAALEGILVTQRENGAALVARGQAALLDRIEAMTSEERADFVERLIMQKERGKPGN